jgi:hypothetical protein
MLFGHLLFADILTKIINVGLLRKLRTSKPDIRPLLEFLINCLVIVLYCCFTTFAPAFCPFVLFLKESFASVLKKMRKARKAKRGGDDFNINFCKSRRACKNDSLVSGLLDLPLFC